MSPSATRETCGGIKRTDGHRTPVAPSRWVSDRPRRSRVAAPTSQRGDQLTQRTFVTALYTLADRPALAVATTVVPLRACK